MSIGKLRHRVSIQLNTPVYTLGVPADSWATIETVYASVEPLSSSEQRHALQNAETVTHKITMRYRADIGTADTEMLPKYQILFGSLIFEVRSVIFPDFRDRWVIVHCEQLV